MSFSLENQAAKPADNDDPSLLQPAFNQVKPALHLDIFLSCGELSGDVALASLLKSFPEKIDPKRVGGVIGPHLKSLGFSQLRNLDGLQVMGFTAVLKSFFFFRRHLKELIHQILEIQPVAVICVDYPSFHLRLAKALRKKGYMGRIIQYVCPTIWAWKANRLKTLEQCFDEVWGILPFEKALFEEKQVDYHYVGNPSLCMAQSYRSKFFSKNFDADKFLSSLEENRDLSFIPASDLGSLGSGLVISKLPKETFRETVAKQTPTYLGLFPGSRPKEIEQNLPLLLKAAEIVEKKLGKQNWYLALASDKMRAKVESFVTSLTIECVSPIDQERKKEQTKAAIAVSGTVCLELALCSIPTVAVYKVSRLNYWIAKYFLRLRLKSFTLPNILLGKSVFPEFIGSQIKPEDIATPLLAWLAAESCARVEMQQALDELYEHMVNCEKQSEKNMVIDKLISWLDSEKATAL